MMIRSTTFAIAMITATMAWSNEQPYAGKQARDIASLSAADVDDLQNGRGWGFALAAELNGYPGPAHILEMSEDLDLSASQVAQVQDIFDRMNARARQLGADYIAVEATLDDRFEDKSITPEELVRLTAEAGQLRAELRAVHLAAHLEAAPILTRHQTHMYENARGYGSSHGHSGHAHD